MPQRKYFSIEEWKKNPTDDALIRKAFVTKVDSGEAPRTKRFTITTDSVDRDGDTIAVDGWDISNYMKNPVVLWAHDSRTLPIGKALEVIASPGKLSAVDEFTTRELNPLGDMVYNLVDQGFLNAVSVGFRPIKWSFNEDRGGSGWMPAYDFLEQELLEHSVVPIPANPDALIEARSAGIDILPLKSWAEEVLSSVEGNGLWLPRSVVERAFDIANGEKRTFKGAAPQQSMKVRVELENADEISEAIQRLTEAATKSGRVLSAANEKLLEEAKNNLDTVLKQVQAEDQASAQGETAKSEDSSVTEGKSDEDSTVLELEDDDLGIDDDDEIDINAEDVRAALVQAGKSFWTGVTGRLD